MYNTIYTVSSIIPDNYAFNDKQIKSNADHQFLLLNGNVYVTNKGITYHVVELLQEDGTSPYAKWFRSLDPLAAAKITVAKLRLQQGNTSNIKWFECIGEYKIDWGPGYRIYLAKDGQKLIILIGGGTKKSQQKDIRQALELWETYKHRKKAENSKR